MTQVEGQQAAVEGLCRVAEQMYSSGITDYRRAICLFRKQFLRAAIKANDGNQQQAAKQLRVHRNTVTRDKRIGRFARSPRGGR